MRRDNAGIGEELVEQFTEQVRTWQGQVETGELALQFRRQGFPDAEEQEQFPAGLGVAQGVAQLADEDRIAILEQGTEVA